MQIAGFIIAGTQPRKGLIRAVGPGLTDDELSGTLADPSLELRDPAGALIAANEDWGDLNGPGITMVEVYEAP